MYNDEIDVNQILNTTSYIIMKTQQKLLSSKLKWAEFSNKDIYLGDEAENYWWMNPIVSIPEDGDQLLVGDSEDLDSNNLTLNHAYMISTESSKITKPAVLATFKNFEEFKTLNYPKFYLLSKSPKNKVADRQLPSESFIKHVWCYLAYLDFRFIFLIESSGLFFTGKYSDIPIEYWEFKKTHWNGYSALEMERDAFPCFAIKDEFWETSLPMKFLVSNINADAFLEGN